MHRPPQPRSGTHRREREDERLLAFEVQARGGLVEKMAPTRRGVPDRLVLLRGRAHLIEMKTRRGRLSPWQIRWHEAAERAGVMVTTLYGADEVRQWLARIDDEDEVRRWVEGINEMAAPDGGETDVL